MNPSIGDQFWKHYGHREHEADDQTPSRVSRRTPDQLHEDLLLLERRTDKLMLICRALWELLQREAKLNDTQLESKLTEIDLRDGCLDQRYKMPVLDCPNCGRKLNTRNRHCIYCGFTDFPHDAFDLS